MFRILIVDDESFEREGVKFLISKYNLELEIIEAGSGEEALDYMQKHPIDILLTDIRMREMDGLELAKQVRNLNLPVKIIFLSAYGEFEYAQKAINLKAIQYILKPVEVIDFLKVLSQVIQMCKDEQKEAVQKQELQEVYRRGIQLEQHKILADLLKNDAVSLAENESVQTEQQLKDVFPLADLLGEAAYRIIMLDTRKRFFDSTDADFEKNLSDLVNRPCIIVHLNEYQSLVLIEVHEAEPTELFTQLGRHIIQWFKALFACEIYVVFSDLFVEVEKMRDEYRKLETILESKFFFEEGTILYTSTSLQANHSSDYIDSEIADITSYLERREFGIVRARFEQLFDNLKNSDRFSAIYVKYICSEIVRSILHITQKKNLDFFKNSLETIYKTAMLKDLRQVMITIFDEYGALNEPGSAASPAESTNKVIEDVIQIIKHEYQTDLSVELIAERVYLTPSYLSHLFTKQIGVSLIKYLTMHRLEKAKQLLQETNRKIIDISNDVGYANFPYFCTLLKNYYGKTPTQIREGSRL